MKKAMVIFLGLAVAGCQNFEVEKVKQGANRPPVHDLVAEKAKEHNVPKQLALAIVQIESRFKPNAVNKNNYGLGQISCGAARSYGLKGPCFTLLDPAVNLQYSMIYLQKALVKADNNWCYAATLYHRGLNKTPQISPYCLTVLKTALLTKP